MSRVNPRVLLSTIEDAFIDAKEWRHTPANFPRRLAWEALRDAVDAVSDVVQSDADSAGDYPEDLRIWGAGRS